MPLSAPLLLGSVYSSIQARASAHFAASTPGLCFVALSALNINPRVPEPHASGLCLMCFMTRAFRPLTDRLSYEYGNTDKNISVLERAFSLACYIIPKASP
jgi:hypothetical protein